MPEGLEQNMTPAEMADLIAYLKAAPAQFGSGTAEEIAQARAKFLADGVNGLAKVLFSSEKLYYPSWLGTFPMPHCRQTDGQSRLIWETVQVPADLRPEAVQTFRLPAAMGFSSQLGGRFHLKLNGKPMLDFEVALNDQIWQSADGNVRMSYIAMQNNSEDSNGILTIEVKKTLLEPGKPATFEVVGGAKGSQRWFGIYLVGN